jgi:hypothetical protein
MDDCVIGCVAGYGWEEIAVWANSLVASGFAGRKVALIREASPDVFEALVARGIEIVPFYAGQMAAPVEVERFGHLRQFLFDQRRIGTEFRWVVTTDVRNVCFQGNPLDFLRRLDPPRLVLAQEGMTYDHAQWNADNLALAFGKGALQMLRMAAPANVGVLAGPHQGIEGLALLIEQLCRAAAPQVADQAALNLLTHALGGSLWLHRSGAAEPWACQAGIMADPRRIAQNRPHLLGPEPLWRDGWVTTEGGERFAIVHQYDRVPEWHAAILGRYGK